MALKGLLKKPLQSNRRSEISMGIKKKELQADLGKAIVWADYRNKEIAMNRTEVSMDTMPTLAKVVFGGVEYLPSKEKAAYEAFLRKNEARLPALMATVSSARLNPAEVGLVASGLIPNTNFASTIISAAAGSTLFARVASAGLAGTGAGVAASLAGLSLIPGIGVVAAAAGVGSAAVSATEAIRFFGKSHEGQQMGRVFGEAQAQREKCCQKIMDNAKSMEDILTQKIKSAIESLERTTKKVAISFDDLVHSDQNLRLMEYQKIVVNQYNSQKEIRDTLIELINAYNALKVENEKFAKQVAAYDANMKMLACANEYIK